MDDDAVPFSSYRIDVPSAWLDYNGHMHDASYAIALSDANEELFVALGLSAGYRHATGASLFTVECHIRFLAECSLGQVLSAETIMVDAGPRKLRLYTELLHQDRSPVATGEFMYVHVDAAHGVTTSMPPDAFARVQAMLDAHARIPRPVHIGLGVAAARESRQA
jgi:acyl-CoA thioester hydrolase